jgi:hypothetical protein
VKASNYALKHILYMEPLRIFKAVPKRPGRSHGSCGRHGARLKNCC